MSKATCGLCDESYDIDDPRQANRHDHDEPQSGPGRDRWVASKQRWGRYARDRIAELEEALGEIARKRGLFNLDDAEHCKNCVEHMSTVAQLALDGKEWRDVP